MDPPWKRLLAELASNQGASPRLERLRERFPNAGSHASLARELLQEMASALGRAEGKVEASLGRLELESRAIEELVLASPHDDTWRTAMNARIAAFNRERDVALHCRWELLVHREALGFRRNE